MSWKSRKAKKFSRLVSRFEKTPITKVASFILIDESAPYMNSQGKRDYHYQRMIHSCKQEIKEGTIQTATDFDKCYSPYFDFTLETRGFEKDTVKANRLAHDCLSRIAKNWRTKIEALYGSNKYIIEVFFRDDEWFLNCYHRLEKKE